MSNPFETTIVRPTDAQIRFATSLLRDHAELLNKTEKFQASDPESQAASLNTIENMINDLPNTPKSLVSSLIDMIKTRNASIRASLREQATHSAPAGDTLKHGVYLSNGMVIRVYIGRQSGRMLAAEITADGTRYLGAASRFVKADQRLSAEDAAKYGAQFGICCVCAADLTDPESVAAGIGPVCRSKY